MHKIIIPHSNPNDEFVFITEWKFNDNDYVKKGDHVLSVETSKVVEEIFSEHEGYLEKLFNLNEKVKVGDAVGILNKKENNKTNIIEKNLNKKLIITKKAQLLIDKNNLNPKLIPAKNLIKEIDVIKYINSANIKKDIKYDQLIVLKKEEQPYHAAVYLADYGIIDLSLLGSKITRDIYDYNFSNCKCDFFLLNLINKKELIKFYKKPALLTDKILKKEKSKRGWSTTVESADYILQFRKKRSKKINDMNCIEWLVYGLELGGIKFPDNVLTANILKKWSEKNLKKIDKSNNLEFFQKLY